MRIHLAILTHNACEFSRRCVQSLSEHTRVPFEATILDNASSDGTWAWLQSLRDERFHVRASDVNLGVPGGRNALLRAILPAVSDDVLIVFLDNDIEVGSGWHEPFERLFAARPDAGMASKVGWAMQVVGDSREPLATPPRTAPVDIVAGGFACFVRPAAARAVGEFDEQLGLFWHEDDDYAVRMAAAGYSVWGVPEARLVHHEHKSGVALPSLSEGLSTRNLAYLARKWREQGWVDAEGWVAHRDPDLYADVCLRRAVAARMRRSRPIGRAEWAHAAWDAMQLAEWDGTGTFSRPISPCLRAMIATRCAGREGAAAASPRLDWALLASRADGALAAAATVCRVAAAPPRATKLAGRLVHSEDFDDEAWLASYRRVFGAAPEAWSARAAERWAAAEVLHALTAAGVLRAGAGGVDLGGLPLGLSLAAAASAAEVTLWAPLDAAAEMEGGPPLEVVASIARQRPGRLRAQPRSAGPPAGGHAFAWGHGGPVIRGDEPRLVAMLHDAAAVLAPGGTAAVVVDVQVAAGGGGAGLGARLCAAGRAVGLSLISEPLAAVSADTAAGLRPPAGEGVWPTLLRGGGRAVSAAAVVFFVRAAPAPCPTEPAHATVALDVRALRDAACTSPRALEQLEAVADAAPGISFAAIGCGDPPLCLWPLLERPNVRYVTADAARRYAYELVHAVEPLALGLDLASPFELFAAERTSATVHAVVRPAAQDWSPGVKHAYARRLAALRRVDVVFTPNAAAAEALLGLVDLPRARVAVADAGLCCPGDVARATLAAWRLGTRQSRTERTTRVTSPA
jgi:GT2 family glycosyltransferase